MLESLDNYDGSPEAKASVVSAFSRTPAPRTHDRSLVVEAEESVARSPENAF